MDNLAPDSLFDRTIGQRFAGDDKMVHGRQRLPVGMDGVVGADAQKLGAAAALFLELVHQLRRKNVCADDKVRVQLANQPLKPGKCTAH